MKGRNRKQTVAPPLVLLIILIPLLFPIPATLADGQTGDQITITFYPRPNEPPSTPINPDPPNGSVDVPVPVTLSVDVYDESSLVVDVYFYNASNDALIDVDYNVSSDWGTASVVWNESLEGRICYWYAIAKDSQYENRSETWVFATRPNQPPIIHNDEYPANTSTNVSIATPYWYVTIGDPENDTFDWTIETSPNIGDASGNNDVNGQKSCPLSGLQYNTNYTVYVNATDAWGGKWTNETFWFITAEQGAPTITNEYPPHRNTQTELQPVCHVDAHDIEGDNLTLYWYEHTSGSWVLRQTDSNISANSTVYWTFSQANSYSTTYYWRVTVNDSTTNTTGTYYFTTEPTPSAQPPPPGGGGYTPNRHPIANITGPNIGYVNETLIFYAYYSYDPDGYIVGYRWDFENDGVYDTEWLEDLLVTCNYPYPGNYTVRLQVKDEDNAITTSDPHSIHIKHLEVPLQLPIPQINGPYYGYTNESLTFSSGGSYDPDGTIINYTWDFGDGNKSYLKNPVHSYAEPGNYTVILTVTDNDNLSNSTTTKAFIIDKEVKGPEEKRKLPLTFLLILLMIIIATILALIIWYKSYRLALWVEKLDASKENRNKNKNADAKADKDRDIDAKVDTLIRIR